MNIGQNRKTLEAISILVGTIVGSGIFAIPYVIMKAGLWVGIFYFLFFTIVILVIHLFYGEIVLRTTKVKRIVGYGEIYLGRSGRNLLFVSSMVGLFGSILGYLILGSSFLATVFGATQEGNPFFVLVFWALLSLGIIFDWKRVSFLDFLMVILLIITVIVITAASFAKFEVGRFQAIDWKYLFLPWGVIFYSMAGASAIPELREVLGENKNKLKRVVVCGTIIPVIIYFLFSLGVIGASGAQTTPDTIMGIKQVFSGGLIYLIAIFGFLCVATSYLALGIILKKIFILDLKIKPIRAISLVCLVPLILYLLGIKNFLQIISFLGLWLGAVEGMLLIAMHRRAKVAGDRQPEYSLKIPTIVYLILGVIFMVGPILSIIFVKY